MTFRKAQPRGSRFLWLNTDLAFKCYVVVALLSTSGLDTLLFVTLMLLAVAAAAGIARRFIGVLFFFASSAARFETDSA